MSTAADTMEDTDIEEMFKQSVPCEYTKWPSTHPADAKWRVWARCIVCSTHTVKHTCDECYELILKGVLIYCNVCKFEDTSDIFFYRVERL